MWTGTFVTVGRGILQDHAARIDNSNSWTILPDGTQHPESRAVKGAVLDFATLVRRQLSIAYEDSSYISWMLRK